MKKWSGLFLLCCSSLLYVKAADVRQPTAPNWPTSYPVNGAVSVSNFPANQQVTGTVSLVTQPLSRFKTMSLSTTPVHIGMGSTDLWAFYGYNNAVIGNERSIHFCNTSTAPIVGTTPSDLTITIGGRMNAPMNLPQPTTFSNGLWIYATIASGDDNKTPPNAGEVSINVFYR